MLHEPLRSTLAAFTPGVLLGAREQETRYAPVVPNWAGLDALPATSGEIGIDVEIESPGDNIGDQFSIGVGAVHADRAYRE